MENGFWIAIVALAVAVLYVWGKVRKYMQQSEEDWKRVDKSKLKEWTDDEDD